MMLERKSEKFWWFLVGSILSCLLLFLPSIIWAKTPSNNVTPSNSPAKVQSVSSTAEETIRAIVKKVSDQLQNPDDPFILMVQIQAKHGFADSVVASYSEQARQAAINPGSLVYELNQDTSNSTRFVLYERWANLDAFIAHETASFTLDHFERVAPMLEASRQLYVLSPLVTSATRQLNN